MYFASREPETTSEKPVPEYANVPALGGNQRGVTMKLGVLCSVALLAVSNVAAGGAWAQAWPTKPVRVIVNYAPGGSTDNATRPIMEKVSTALGQQFVIENRGGASGAIGAEIVKNAPADGYTLLGMTVAMVCITPHLQPIPYDPVKDFVPVARMATSWGALAAHRRRPGRPSRCG